MQIFFRLNQKTPSDTFNNLQILFLNLKNSNIYTSFYIRAPFSNNSRLYVAPSALVTAKDFIYSFLYQIIF